MQLLQIEILRVDRTCRSVVFDVAASVGVAAAVGF